MAGPLSQIKIVDLSAVVSGPLCTQILADQGAEVIKIEPLGIGDASRGSPYRVGDISGIYAGCNRGKRSVALDLKSEQGRDVVKALVKDADVLVENFRPGVCDRMGLGFDDLKAINPNLIYASITGFGSDGPYRDDRAYDPIIQALSGVISIQRHPGGAAPDVIRTVIADKSTGFLMAQAITAALFARERGTTGGQHIEIPLLGTLFYFLWPDTFPTETFLGDDVIKGPPLYQMINLQPTADGHIVLFAQSDRETKGLVEALGHPEWWDEPGFNDRALRFTPEQFMANKMRLDEAFAKVGTAEIVERLHAADVPVAPVLSLAEALENEQVVAAGFIKQAALQSGGQYRYASYPVRFSDTACEPSSDLEALGQSTDAVLSSL